MKISCEIIGKVDSGDVSKITMENDNGVVISTLTTGATLQEFLVPTETGALKNIVLGFSDYEDYYKNNLCACQSIGRVAGRIGKASYTHNMVLYSLPKNEGENCLHGGPKGMQVQNWNYVTNLTEEYVETKFVRRLYSDLTTAIAYQSSLKPSMLQSQQSLIRPIMSTLILVTSKICQLMS